MKWNTPATSQKEELLFAINEMRENRQQVSVVHIRRTFYTCFSSFVFIDVSP